MKVKYLKVMHNANVGDVLEAIVSRLPAPEAVRQGPYPDPAGGRGDLVHLRLCHGLCPQIRNPGHGAGPAGFRRGCARCQS